jgi:hypothetical protein
MPEHEPGGAERDGWSGRKPEFRAARSEEGHPRWASAGPADEAVPSDDPEVASEPMTAETTLSRLGPPDPKRVPPGRQLSGEPPVV